VRGVTYIAILYWCLAAALALCASLPYLTLYGFRFSLRTMLIATTVLAVILGAAVVASR
jgi:hypothetical protein